MLVNGKPVLREGDVGCGEWVAVEGARHVLVNGRRIHRINDRHSSSESCDGSSNTMCGDNENKLNLCVDNETPRYFLVINITMASSRTQDGTSLEKYALPLSQDETSIEVFYDFRGDGNVYRNQVVQVDATSTYTRGQKYPIVLAIPKSTLESLRGLLIWAPGMRASFYRNGCSENFATGRLFVPRNLMEMTDARCHPNTEEPVPDGSQKIVVNVEILKHPAQYILDEMIANAHGNEIPTDEVYNHPGNPITRPHFIKIGVRWAWKAANDRDWDYKLRMAGIWGNIIRNGNYPYAMHNEGFSNYHYGYVAAVGGLPLEDARDISRYGSAQFPYRKETAVVSIPTGLLTEQFPYMTGTTEAIGVPMPVWRGLWGETEADQYAITRGHNLFTKDGSKSILFKKKRMLGRNVAQTVVSLPTGDETMVDLNKEARTTGTIKGSIKPSFLQGPTWEYYEYFYAKQTIDADPTFEQVRKFLLDYQQRYPRR